MFYRWRWPLVTGVGLLCGLLCIVPDTSKSIPTLSLKRLDGNSEIAIKNWQLVGPFTFDKEDLKVPQAESVAVGLGRTKDYLRQFGPTENEAGMSDLTRIAKIKISSPSAGRVHSSRVSAFSSNNIITLGSTQDSMQYSVNYFATEIVSAVDQDIVFAIGVTGNVKLWLNHSLLISDDYTTKRHIDKFQHIVGAHLKKGHNFLLIKLGYLEDWDRIQLMATIYSRERGLSLAHLNGANPILRESVIKPNAPLRLHFDLFNGASTATMSILNDSKAILKTSTFSVDHDASYSLSGMKEDEIYLCRMSVGSELIERPFYYGSIAHGYNNLLAEAHALKHISSSSQIDLFAELERTKLLLPDKMHAMERWDEMVTDSFWAVRQGLKELHQGDAAFRTATGTHLRGYQSSVDQSIQYYWLHVPSKVPRTEKSFPLVIILPFEVPKNNRFLESYFINASNYTERYRILGDEYGFAVAQLWARGNRHLGTAIEASDVFDALAAIRRDYRVDASRIYLMGYCEGGTRALLLAEHYPNTFAAIATDHPVTNKGNSQSVWMQYSSPITAIQQLRGTPVYISHDKEEPFPRIRDSEDFAKRGRAMGVDITFVQKHGGGGIHGFSQDPAQDIRSFFEFFKTKYLPTNEETPSTLRKQNFARFPVGTGPIEDAFGGPVLIVEGTLGNPEERESVHQLSQQLVDEWRKTYFVDCPMKRDVDLLDEDLHRKTLILVGDTRTNRQIKHFANYLPMRSSPEGISIGNRVILGQHLGYIYRFSNPVSPEGTAIVVGMNNWARSPSFGIVPSRDGIYDYFVIDLTGTTARQVANGYYGDSH